jgi:hypothetical protein
METRKCNYCGGTIPTDKRADSKFCSNSCKASHWEENKTKNKPVQQNFIAPKPQPKVSEMPLEGLRGVIENKPEIDVSDVKETSKQPQQNQSTAVIIGNYTQAYKNALAQKDKAQSDFQRVNNVLKLCVTNLKDWQIVKENLKYTKALKKHQVINIDTIALQEDVFLHEVLEYEADCHKQKTAEEQIDFLVASKYKLDRVLSMCEKIYRQAVLNLRLIPFRH